MRKLRLDKVLSHMGYGSRSEVRLLVKKGGVTVNGIVVKDSGVQVAVEIDQIVAEGVPVVYREFVYLMLNKPQGVVSATEDKRDRTVVELVDAAYQHYDLFPVGRLDKDTEGLLILTNDGALAHQLLSPKKHVPKMYYAVVQGEVGEADQVAFQKGVQLDDGYVTLPAQLKVLRSQAVSEIELTIMEGKYHQVKRMFEAVGKRVVYLKRMSMGLLQLDPELDLGASRELMEVELFLLKGGARE